MKALVSKILEKDKIVCIDQFISEVTCDKIIQELQYCFWKQSTVVDPQNRESHVSNTRYSKSADQLFFSKTLLKIIKHIETEIKSLFGVNLNTLEHWQATKYPIQGKFDYHYDGGVWSDHHAGERKKTYLLYLNKPKKGGATHFKNLDLTVKPKQGRLLVWDNLEEDGSCNYNMLHAGLPIEKGKKLTLVTWERERKIR